MKKLLVLAFVIPFLFTSGSQADFLNAYLAGNSVSLEEGNFDLSIMGSDLSSTVFLSGGQWHGTVANYDLQYSFLTAFHRQAGVNYLLLDTGYTTGQVYNEYILTGNPDLLRWALDGVRFSNSSSDEHRFFWEKLYKFNQGLPPEERIRVAGIDLEYQIGTALNYLDYLGQYRFLETLPVMEYLGNPESLQRYVDGIKLKYAEDPALFEEIFNSDLPRFDLALENLEDTVRANLSASFFSSREQVMYDNFLKVYNANPQGKFFGHFTMEHVFQRQVNTGDLTGAARLGMLLQADASPVQGKVVSIGAYYRNSAFRFYFNRYERLKVYNPFIIEPLPQPSDNFTLYRLSGDNSPFTWAPYTIPSASGGATTDYYQYLLMVKNSPATSPNLMSPNP